MREQIVSTGDHCSVILRDSGSRVAKCRVLFVQVPDHPPLFRRRVVMSGATTARTTSLSRHSDIGCQTNDSAITTDPNQTESDSSTSRYHSNSLNETVAWLSYFGRKSEDIFIRGGVGAERPGNDGLS